MKRKLAILLAFCLAAGTVGESAGMLQAEAAEVSGTGTEQPGNPGEEGPGTEQPGNLGEENPAEPIEKAEQTITAENVEY